MGDIFFHGTHAPLFGRFSSDHLREGSGRTRYGFGHYVTDDVGHALHYAAKGATEETVLLYTVEVPALTPDNHITYHEPVDPSILARVGAALGGVDGTAFPYFPLVRQAYEPSPSAASSRAKPA